MNKNVENFVSAIRTALNEQSTRNLFEISITLREMWWCGEKENIFCLNGKSHINIGKHTLYRNNIKKDLESAINFLREERPEQCKNIHLVYEKTSSGTKVCRISLKRCDTLDDGEFVKIA